MLKPKFISAGPLALVIAHAATARATEIVTVTAANPPATAASTAPLRDDLDPATPPPAVYGLMPLWEHTGAVEASGAARGGMRHAQVGIYALTLGTDPYLVLYGTLNAYAKLGLKRTGRVRLALNAGAYLVPTAAESRSIGNVHASTFVNPYAAVTLVPVALGATFLVRPRLHLHGSATVLRTLSAAPESTTLTWGATSWLEWWANNNRSVRVHVGAEGWPTETQEHVGISFGYRTRHVAVQAGYARRFGPEGTSANSIMFDGAVLFP